MSSQYQALYRQMMSQLAADIQSGNLQTGNSAFASPFEAGLASGFYDGPFGPKVGMKGGAMDTGTGAFSPGGKGPPPTTMSPPMSSPGFSGHMPSPFYGKGAMPPPSGKSPFPHLAAPPPPSTPPPSFNCTICNSTYPNQNALSLHRYQAHGHRHIAVHGAESSYVSVGGAGGPKGKGSKGSKGLVYKSCSICGYNGNLLRFAWCNRCHSPLPASPTGIASAPGYLTGKSGISGVLPAKPFPPSAPLATVYSPEAAIPMTGVVDDKTDVDVEITYPPFMSPPPGQPSSSTSFHPEVNPKSAYPPAMSPPPGQPSNVRMHLCSLIFLFSKDQYHVQFSIHKSE